MSDRASNPSRKVLPSMPREQFDAVVAERDSLKASLVALLDAVEAQRGRLYPASNPNEPHRHDAALYTQASEIRKRLEGK